MTNIIGTPTRLAVRISRKLTDGNYGSLEVSAELEVNLPPEANLDDAYDSLSAYLEAKVGQDAKLKAAEVEVRVTTQTVVHPEFTDDDGVVFPAQESSETEVFDVTAYEIAYTPKGQKILKVKGGKWTKFGVTVWPEVAEQSKALEGWDSRDAGEYTIGGKLTAVVLMEGGKPKKVVGWR